MMSLEQSTYFHLFKHGNFTGICIYIYIHIYVFLFRGVFGVCIVLVHVISIASKKNWGDTLPPP